MKLLPPPSKGGNTYNYDEGMDLSYSGMVYYCQDVMIEYAWIIDSRASNHMTGYEKF